VCLCVLQACEREESYEEQIRSLTARLSEVRIDTDCSVIRQQVSVFTALQALSWIVLTDETPSQIWEQSASWIEQTMWTERECDSSLVVNMSGDIGCNQWWLSCEQVEARASESERTACKLQRDIDRLEGTIRFSASLLSRLSNSDN